MRHIFKPLRNYLRTLNFSSTVDGIWHLSRHLQFHYPLPDWLRPANPYNLRAKTRLGFYLWELETLSREAAIHSPRQGGSPVNQWQQIRKALNLLKETENSASSYAGEGTIFDEMRRIAHRQFHWQRGTSQEDLTRYSKIYSYPALDVAVKSVFGLSSDELFLGSFGLLAAFMEHEHLTPDFSKNAARLLGFDVQPIIDQFSMTESEFSSRSIQARRLTIDWAYTFNPLRQYPLLRRPSGLVTCMISGLLAQRFTDGLYYDLIAVKNVGARALGPAFQSYIGEVTRVAGTNLNCLPEQRYGNAGNEKDSVDWLVSDHTATLFVECKVLRLSINGKTEINAISGDSHELRRLAHAIGQLYATISEALKGNYPHWQPNDQPIIPLLVTLDDWKLFTHIIQDRLDGLIETDLLNRKLDPALLTRYPYLVLCASEFEHAIQVINNRGIMTVLEGALSGEKRGWLFEGYLRDVFGDDLEAFQPIFPANMQRLIDSVRPGS